MKVSVVRSGHRALRRIVGLATLLLMAACSAPPKAAALADATYAGEGMTLTLFADHSFRLRLRDPGAGDTPDDHDLGRWARQASGPWCCAAGAKRPCASVLRPGLGCTCSTAKVGRFVSCSARPRSTG